MFQQRRLKSVLIISLLLTFILPIILFGLPVYKILIDKLEEQIISRNGDLARALAIETDTFLAQPVNDINQIKRTVFEKKIVNEEKINAYLEELLKSHKSFESIQILDPQGNIRYIAPYKDNYVGLDMSAQDYYKAAANSENLYWSPSFISMQTGQPTLTVSMPMSEGVIVGFIKLTSLNSRLPNFDGKSYSVIMDLKGTYVAHTDIAKILEREIDQNLGMFIKDGNNKTLELKVNGKKMLASVAYVRQTKWPVVIYQDFDEIYTPVQRAKDLFVFGLLFSVVMAALILWKTVGKISRYLEELTHSAGEIAAGNYQIEIKDYGFEELNVLARQFKVMSQGIMVREEDLQETNCNLEQSNEEITAMNEELIAAEEELRAGYEEIQKNREQLVFISYHDALTGLNNRTFFEHYIAELEGKKDSIGFILADLDGLKSANDTMGHQVGDQLLKETANILRQSTSKEDMIARIGGDEFAIIVADNGGERINNICFNIEKAIEHYNKNNNFYSLSLSVGSSHGLTKGRSIMDFYRQADNDMYRMKLHHKKSSGSSIVPTLLKTLEARDFITEGHGERINLLMEAVGNKLGLTSNKIFDMILFANFHDLGKLGIPDRILFKADKLTEEEMQEMQKHSEIGYRIARSSIELIPIADFILKHHERWDGNGYPLGLKEEKIPLECRLLAIFDAYDAMTNDRPYRQAISHAEAVEELYRFAGKQFDPLLIPIAVEILEKNSA